MRIQRNRVWTRSSQIALPQVACDLACATSGYEASIATVAQVSLSRDNVFGEDGGAHRLGTVSGDVSSGFIVQLPVPVRATQLRPAEGLLIELFEGLPQAPR